MMVRWRKSSYSGLESNCVEVGGAPGLVGVRDSKDAEGPVLEFGRAQWSAFVTTVRSRRR